MKEIAHHSEAQYDIFGAVRFYEDCLPGLGTRFLRMLDETIMKIASDPQRFSFYERPIRSCRVSGFPYKVLFVDESEFVLIVAVSHTSRQPGWWRHRIEN